MSENNEKTLMYEQIDQHCSDEKERKFMRLKFHIFKMKLILDNNELIDNVNKKNLSEHLLSICAELEKLR